MLIYLLRYVFNKVILTKPRSSSMFSNEQFIICVGSKKEHGRQLGEIFLNEYDKIMQYETLPFALLTLKKNVDFQLKISNYSKLLLTNYIKFYENLLYLEHEYRSSDHILCSFFNQLFIQCSKHIKNWKLPEPEYDEDIENQAGNQ